MSTDSGGVVTGWCGRLVRQAPATSGNKLREVSGSRTGGCNTQVLSESVVSGPLQPQLGRERQVQQHARRQAGSPTLDRLTEGDLAG